MTDKTCPPLGTGSIDFARVQEAALKDGDLEAAIEAARVRVELPDDPPALGGKTKAKLKEIAAKEGVNLPDEAATNAEIAEAIETRRDEVTEQVAEAAATTKPGA